MGPARAEADSTMPDLWVAYQRKSLDNDPRLPWWLKWFLRRVYDHYDWAANDHDGKSYCQTEWRGVFTDESDARWAASCPGGQYRSLPFEVALPEETVGYGKYDVPLSSHSAKYRHKKLPFVAVPREQIERLEEKIRATDPIVGGMRAKAI